jgi:ribosomal protein S18 acetylase RimI-like enzyme
MTKIIKLPLGRWEEYRNLRLRALKEDPQAFGASYEDNLKNPPSEWQRRLENAMEANGNWLFFAEEKGKLVGMIGAFIEKGVTDTATVIAVFVPNEERGKGVGNILMQTLLTELKEKPDLKKAKLMVNEKQTEAVGLYKKFGFIEIGKENFKMGNGELATELVMEKYL